MKRLASVLFWSVIAAAFIGPGTVTACGAAGAGYGTSLLWALSFSGIACFTLQEAAARVSAISGITLAEAIRQRRGSAVTRVLSVGLVAAAILLGCAAYEAGNLLGAVTGIRLIAPGISVPIAVIGLSIVAAALLASGTASFVARSMGCLVAVMAVAFLATSIRLDPDLGTVARGAFVPAAPTGAALAVLGLVGTTVVPYNLFLGSGLARTQRLQEVRFGLAVAIGLGVAVSMSIVVVGTTVTGAFSLEHLADALGRKLGGWASTLFAVGLGAAGFSSAVTAPLAAGMTATGLFGLAPTDRDRRDGWFRAAWIGVLLSGVAFGVAGFRPVALILGVQAFNGVLLPLVALFLWLVVNDRAILGERVNGWAANAVFAATAWITLSLGVWGVLRAGATALGRPAPTRETILLVTGVVTLTLAGPIVRELRRARRGGPST